MRRAPVKLDAEAVRLKTTKTTYKEAALAALENATPAQISAFVDNNVTDLASARALMKKMLLMITALYRHSQVRDV